MEREKGIYRVTLLGGAINVILLAFKFIAGFLAGSAAMVADAVHSLSDFATDVVVLIFVRISSKPADECHDYGHGKYETLATATIGLALLAVAVGIIYGGAQKIVVWARGEQLPQPGTIALWAALVSILLKELTYRITVRKAKEYESSALEANAWHHRSDALSSIGTAVGIGGAILLGNRWTVLDPIASVVVGAFIVKVAIDLLKEGLGELMDKSLPEEEEAQIIALVESFEEVGEPHHLRTRRVGNRKAIEMHIRMDGNMSLMDAHEVTKRIEAKIREKFGPETYINIHTEPFK